MASLLPLLAALLTAPTPGTTTSAPTALSEVALDLADQVGAPVDGRRSLALTVESRTRPLAAPLETALSQALSRLGYSVVALPSATDAEASTRSGGQDWLLRVQAGLVPGRREIALVGEVIPAWDSFFLQHRPGARAQPPRLVQALRPADPETLLLCREAAPPGSPFAALRTLARIPGRVLSLAIGDAGDGPAIAVATAEAVLLLSSTGGLLARRDFDLSLLRPVRDPAAALALGDFGGGRLAVQLAGAPRAEVLARHGDRLEVVATLEAAPLCASEGSRLFGAFSPGKGLFLDQLETTIDPAARPRSPRELYGVSAAPHGGRIAFATLDTNLSLELLGPDLEQAAPPIAGVGVGFALADLHGDGDAELIASLPRRDGEDRARIFAPRAERPLVFESPPLKGSIEAAAGGDLTGDGVDDAVLALVERGPDGAPTTELLLLTSDPRELP